MAPRLDERIPQTENPRTEDRGGGERGEHEEEKFSVRLHPEESSDDYVIVEAEWQTKRRENSAAKSRLSPARAAASARRSRGRTPERARRYLSARATKPRSGKLRRKFAPQAATPPSPPPTSRATAPPSASDRKSSAATAHPTCSSTTPAP